MDTEIASWRILLNPEIKDKLAASFLKGKTTVLKVGDVYLTDAALAVHFQMNTTDKCDESQVKEAVAGILRLISGYAEQQRVVVPTIGVISPLDEGKGELAKKVKKWAADQDWHRGDFSLFYSPNKEAEKTISTLLSSAATLWRDSDKIIPLTSEVYLQWLKKEYEVLQSTDEHKDLIKTIIDSWETGKPIKDGVLKWAADSLAEVEVLAEGGE